MNQVCGVTVTSVGGLEHQCARYEHEDGPHACLCYYTWPSEVPAKTPPINNNLREFTVDDLPGMWEEADLIGGATDD